MSATRSYLDYNASAPLYPAARTAMLAAMEAVGNPSSVHAEGRAARRIVEDAREQVAALVGGSPADVIFTSGGSEAANTAIRGGYDTILLAPMEHACVGEAAAACAARIVELEVGSDGVVEPRVVEHALDRLDGSRGRTLLALQAANNETGVLQPLAEVAGLAHRQGVEVFSDAVQLAGRLPMTLASLGADAIALSAHKLGGPKGIGAIVTRPGWKASPLVRGGGQERGRRAGTENVIGIAGFAAAAAAARAGLAGWTRIAALRDRLEAEVTAATPGCVVVGAGVARLPNTSCIAMPGASAETLVIRCDLEGVAISAGAACSSGKVGRSRVLDAMGLGTLARSAIRVSLGPSTTTADVERFVAAWQVIHAGAGQRRVA